MSRGLLYASSLALIMLSAVTVARADVYDDSNCSDRLVLCLNERGKLAKPPHTTRFFAGEAVHVIVFGQPLANGTAISIDFIAISRGDTELQAEPSSPPSPAPPGPAAAKAALLPPPPPQVIKDRMITMPSADEVALTITETPASGSPTIGSTTLGIVDSLYFARPALAFVWVDNGSRTITPEHTVVQSAASFAGVALQVWPWGHRNRTLSAFETFDRRSLGDLISIQVGTDLDFTKPFDRAFVGLTLEPISGLGISVGGAVTTGQFFSGAPSSSMMTVVDKYMLQPYVSLTLSSELFNTLKTLAGSQTEKAN